MCGNMMIEYLEETKGHSNLIVVQQDQLIVGWLKTLISMLILASVSSCTTVHVIWKTLKSV